MKHKIRVSCLAALAAASVVIAGCGNSEPPVEEGRFKSLPKDCADLTAPVAPAVKEFAGALYVPTEKFSAIDTSGLPELTDTSTVMCSIHFSDISPFKKAGAAQYRYVDISIDLGRSKNPVESAIGSFRAEKKNWMGSSPTTAGIGDESFASTEGSGNDARAKTHFRISNINVDLIASGENSTGQSASPQTSSDAAQLVSELQSGSSAIARSLFENIGSVVQ
ncbi:MAG: hypothetical protein J2P31_14040 [Blastocatellia bacterium]|nr:hypothetical protein [Blastocatellia bacterium]